MITIEVPLPDYFTYKSVNIYLIKEDPITLIDTGPYTEDIVKFLKEKFSEFKLKFSDIKRIILTHGHIDHTGLAGFFETKFNTEVFIHEKDYRKIILSSREKLEFKQKTLGTLLKNYGFNEKLINKLTIFFKDFYKFNIPINNPIKFSKDKVFKFENSIIKSIELPGHTAGSTGFLFNNFQFATGDALLDSTFVTPILEFDENCKSYKNLKNYYFTLKKFLCFKDCQIYPGHGNPNFDFHLKAKQIIEYIELKADEIRSKIDFSKTLKENFEQLINTTPEKFFFHFSFFYGLLEFIGIEDKLKWKKFSFIN